MDSIFSIYTLIYLPMAFSVFVRNINKQHQLVIFWIIILTLFRGLRWKLGTDWHWYAQSFEDIDISNFLLFITTEDSANSKILEQGWTTLMLLCKTLYPYYTTFLLISNFIILCVYYKIAKLLTINVLPCFVLIVFSNQFFPVRQTFAVAFFMLGVCFVLKGDRIKYFYSVIIAIFFHYSTFFISLYYYVLTKTRFSYLIYLFILFFSFGIEKVFDRLIPLFISIADVIGMGWLIEAQLVIDNVEVVSIFGSFTTFLSSLFFVSYLYYCGIFLAPQNLRNDTTYITTFHTLMMMVVIGYAIDIIFVRNFTYIARMASFFETALPVLYVYVFDKLKGFVRMQSLLIIFLFILYRYFFKIITYYPELHFPYNSIFD